MEDIEQAVPLWDETVHMCRDCGNCAVLPVFGLIGLVEMCTGHTVI